MTNEPLRLYDQLMLHGVEAVIIGGHAVNLHGHLRATEDIDIIFRRTTQNELALLECLRSVSAFWIGSEIDPQTGIEVIHAVDLPYVQQTRVMMLGTDLGFLDIFDFVPGIPDASVEKFLDQSIEINGRRFASLTWLRRMKQASGRPIDLLDLEKLPMSPDQ